MKSDAQAHAEEDRRKRELTDVKNRGDGLVHQTRRTLDEHGQSVDAELRSRIESALSNLEAKLKEDTKEPIEAAIREVESAASELGKAIYEQASAGGAATETATGSDASSGDREGSGDEDVIDAEYEVKDDERKG